MSTDQALLEAIERGNPVVFFDVSIGGMPAGRIKIELFADVISINYPTIYRFALFIC